MRTQPTHEAGSLPVVVEDLTVFLGDVKVLDSVTFSLGLGEQVALVGPNGAGKSTLLRTIAGLLHPAAGRIKVYGLQPPGHICIGYLPQRPAVDWSFPLTVWDVVMMGRIGRLGLMRRPGRHDREVVAHCLASVGLEDIRRRRISHLSGGQQQRMFIARALAQEAELLLMDEPLTGLDATSQEAILGLLPELRRRGVAAIVATHDLSMSATRFERIMLLNGHLIAEGPAEKVFTEANLLAAYGGNVHRIHGAQVPLAVSDSCCHDAQARR